jgi:hypothetical protein
MRSKKQTHTANQVHARRVTSLVLVCSLSSDSEVQIRTRSSTVVVGVRHRVFTERR